MTLAKVLFKAITCMVLGWWLNHKWYSQGDSMKPLGVIGTGSSLVTWRSIHRVTVYTTARVGNCRIKQNWVPTSQIPPNVHFCRAHELRIGFYIFKGL